MYNFLLGMLFVFICIPIIENINTLIANRIQLSSYRTSKQIFKIKKQIEEMGIVEQEQECKHPFGFQAPDCIGVEIDNNEYEEDDSI